MPTTATAAFQVTGWDQTPTSEPGVRPAHSKATVTKTFSGDLEGTSTAEVLMCQADPADLAAGAGYIGSEIVTGSLGGRAGSFVMQHGGISEVQGAQWTYGHIVPGSGTEQLAGLSGTVEITMDPQGKHTLTLEYELPG